MLHFWVKIHKFLMLNVQIEPKKADLIIHYLLEEMTREWHRLFWLTD